VPRHFAPENSVKGWAGFGGITFGTFDPNSSRSCRSSRGIPNELDKAAELDGSSQLGIVLWIIRPPIRPALTTATLVSFSWTWEDFLTPLVYLNEPTLDTISVALRSSADPSSATDGGGGSSPGRPCPWCGAGRVRRHPAQPGHRRSDGLTGPWP
jgi:ABC-type Fe3+ transport system permease subunit